MSRIVKHVDRGIASNTRTQNYTNDDAEVGDILMVGASLGRPAHEVRIESSGGSMSVRLNVLQTVFPQRGVVDGLAHTGQMLNLAGGVEYQTTDTALITIETGTIYTITTVPINDIELVTVSGTFDIFTA